MNRPSSSRRCALVTLGFALCAAPLALLAGSPRVSSVYPSGGQRGTEMEVTLAGSQSEGCARMLLFDDAGFERLDHRMRPRKAKLKANIKIAPDARLGEHHFRVITESGISDLRLFYVSPFPMVEEQPRRSQAIPTVAATGARSVRRSMAARPVKIRTTFWSKRKKGSGSPRRSSVCACRSGSLYDPALSITREDGTKIVEVDDTSFGRQDPLASFLAPEDGKYVITIRDATNNGDGECHYLLHIGTFAQPLAVYPPGGPAGEDLNVKLLGDAPRPLTQTVKLPAQLG